MHRQDEHLELRPFRFDGAQDGDAVGSLHVEVEHQDVRIVGLRSGERGTPISRFRHDRDARLVFEDAPNAAAHERVIVGEDDASRLVRHAAPPTGIRA